MCGLYLIIRKKRKGEYDEKRRNYSVARELPYILYSILPSYTYASRAINNRQLSVIF